MPGRREQRKGGLPRITVHDARRTCATLLADLEVHPRVAMQIMRHADFAVTMEIYTSATRSLCMSANTDSRGRRHIRSTATKSVMEQPVPVSAISRSVRWTPMPVISRPPTA